MSVNRENDVNTNSMDTTQADVKVSRIHYRRRAQAGQSAIIAVIVLFLLMFLATIFIAIVARNMSNTRNAANTSAARRYADAGINYVDKQLMESAEGADWRPAPDCVAAQPCTVIGERDPDYLYLQPYNPQTGEGGFTRVNFGSETGGGQSTAATAGGRALIRVTYQPGTNDGRQANPSDPLSRYIKIESIGRAGQINPLDPTTYVNTEGISQRVELVAYKAIGLNEYTRFITNRDSKPVSVALGSPFDVRDRGTLRSIPTVINGPIRVNAGLTFFGENFIYLNPYRGDAIEVSGPIGLNRVPDNVPAGGLAATDPTRVYVSTQGLPANIAPAANGAGNLYPSGSLGFTTLGPLLAQNSNFQLNGIGLVRDNPRGAETQTLNPEVDGNGNTYQNLRSTPKLAVPTIDAATGPGGLTRYRQLTRESAPLDPTQVENNPIVSTAVLNNAGVYGWGQGLYLGNTNDTQAPSESLFSGYSMRADWLNPASGSQSTRLTYWRGDMQYEPPAVTIELTPRFIKMTRSAYDNNNGQQAFNFRNQNGQRLRDVQTIVRYTKVAPAGTGNGNAPGSNFSGTNPQQEYQGYPAVQVAQGVYEGEYVIFAEGNIRIKGVVGGYDPESKVYFKRHLTVVSNGTIYVDGNLLRDNIVATEQASAAKAVQGESTIALLAKQYIAVNTTQFLSPVAPASAKVEPESGTDASGQPISGNAEEPGSLVLTVREPQLLLSPSFAPIMTTTTTPTGAVVPAGFVMPDYVTNASSPTRPAVYVRHRTAGQRGASATFRLNDPIPANYINFTLYSANVPDSPINLALNQFAQTGNNSNSIQPGVYLNERFDLPASLVTGAAVNGDPASAAPRNLLEIKQDVVPNYESDYQISRASVVPLDIRIEALMYAQEGSFFIIPGPWFNANPNDSYEHLFVQDDVDGATFGRRYGEIPSLNPDGTVNPRPRVNHWYPLYKEPQDIRITLCGAITENLPAEIADQGAWLEKWGWVPQNYGSTGIAGLRSDYPPSGQPVPTVHGPGGALSGPNNKGNGIVYEFDERALAPYAPMYSADNGTQTIAGVAVPRPLRRNPYNPYQPLPFAPRLPVAPGFLYYGQPTQR